jgi:Rha family phage regulatory protein
MSSLALNYQNFIIAVNEEPKTSSLKVAEAFGKRHGDVIRKVESLECSEDFSQRNFASAEYLDEQGKARKSYEITKDGFMFLVMGFTGKAAAQIKEAYINAFNWMAAQLVGKNESLKLSELPQIPKNPHLAVKNAVLQLAGTHDVKYGTVYKRLYDRFQVEKYQDLAVEYCPAAVEFVRSLHGEYIPRIDKPSTKVIPDDAIKLIRDFVNAALDQNFMMSDVWKALALINPKDAIYYNQYIHKTNAMAVRVSQALDLRTPRNEPTVSAMLAVTADTGHRYHIHPARLQHAI